MDIEGKTMTCLAEALHYGVDMTLFDRSVETFEESVVNIIDVTLIFQSVGKQINLKILLSIHVDDAVFHPLIDAFRTKEEVFMHISRCKDTNKK